MAPQYNKIENLYRRMFQAEQEGDHRLATLIKGQLDELMIGTGEKKIDFNRKFLEEIKPKRVYDDLQRLINGELNELEASIEVCSLLTHSLVAARDKTLSAYEFLDIGGQADLLLSLIRNEVGVDEIKKFYKKLFYEEY